MQCILYNHAAPVHVILFKLQRRLKVVFAQPVLGQQFDYDRARHGRQFLPCYQVIHCARCARRLSKWIAVQKPFNAPFSVAYAQDIARNQSGISQSVRDISPLKEWPRPYRARHIIRDYLRAAASTAAVSSTACAVCASSSTACGVISASCAKKLFAKALKPQMRASVAVLAFDVSLKAF